MLKFKSFLKEETQILLERALSSDVESDDKGKLHELLLAKHLHPDNTLPMHHRSESENEEHAGTPQQVHDRLQKKIGDAAYNEIDSHAKQSAEAFKKDLHDRGILNKDNHIGNVHWTSNADKPNAPGDHEKTTGTKDVNSNADVILTLKDKEGKTVGYHGISAKYGTNKPNYRNPGLESMENTAGIEHGSLKKLMDSHHKHMEALGYNGSADKRNTQYKIDKMGIDKAKVEHAKFEKLASEGKTLSKKNKLMHEHLGSFIQAHDSLPASKQAGFEQHAAARAAGAEASALKGKQQIAAKFAGGLAKRSDPELRDIIRQHVSAPTVIPHSVVHSKVKENGTAESVIKPSESIADNHLNQFENLHVAHTGGISTYIKGKHKETGKIMNVAQFSTKGSSGPHKGVVGAFSL
jgi:hypothetical protein